MYDDVYTRVFEIYGSVFSINPDAPSTSKDGLVALLRPELEGKAILDVGCGAGEFLISCANLLKSPRLLGLDVFAKDLEVPEKNLTFLRRDVIRFSLEERFDVAITDNVMEHIAPQDVPEHLASIAKALKPSGQLIILTPHRYFGPWDVTRIIDDSYSGWIAAQGTHLKEYTYAELSETLRQAGFTDLQALHPKARIGYRPLYTRMSLSLLLRGEKRSRLIRRLQAMNKAFRYPAFEIALIARKGQG
jgi:2-polyprenyl-3-methyl-5-hydroxy-6-metoxy-1,4-benzoquinol methylase